MTARDALDLAGELKLQFDNQLLASITVSIGIAGFPDHGGTCDELLRLADRSLYQSKAAGRDRVTLADALSVQYQPTGREAVSDSRGDPTFLNDL